MTARGASALLAGAWLVASAAVTAAAAQAASGAPREPAAVPRVLVGGLSVGAGLSVPVGRVVIFGEARATLMPTAALSDTPGLRGAQLPLVVGVRF